MKRILQLITIGLLGIAVASSVVHAAEPEEQKMGNKTFTGATINEELAYEKAQAVLEATIIDQGLVSPGPPGEAYYEGMRIRVVQNFKGQYRGEISLDASIKTLPKGGAESAPDKGDTVILFVGGDGMSSNRVQKILPATSENKDFMQRLKDRKKD